MATPSSPDQPQSEAAAAEARFLRAATSFEAILLSQIELKKELGQRLNYAVRTGTIILGILAISILILLLTLSSQITRISAVVHDMNQDISIVASQMGQIKVNITSMEQRVSLMEGITKQTSVMQREMGSITSDMAGMVSTINGIKQHVTGVRTNVDHIASTINHLNANVQLMNQDMHRMGQPARSMNKMFPFP